MHRLPWTLIRDAIHSILEKENRIIRVIGDPVKQAGLLLEITMDTAPLRAAMIDYGLRILGLSAVISVLTAGLLFFAVRRVLVTPIRRVVNHMSAYAEAPEDARRFIVPQSGVVELREAEVALQMMQKQLTGALKQKERLAQLGGAVARISHDLAQYPHHGPVAGRPDGNVERPGRGAGGTEAGKFDQPRRGAVRIDADLRQGRRTAADPDAFHAGGAGR